MYINGPFPRCQSFLTEHSPLLIQWIRVMIVRWQYDLVNKKESILHVCDKPYHKNKKKYRKGEEFEILQKSCCKADICLILVIVTQEISEIRFL